MQKLVEVIGMKDSALSPIVLFIDISQKMSSVESRTMLINKAKEIGLNDNNSKFLFCTDEYPVESLYLDIETLNPLSIIAVGSSALSKLVPDAKGGILKNRGKVFKYDEKYLLIPTIHPNYIIQNPTDENKKNLLEDIRLGMKAASNIAMSKNKGEEFDYEHFSESLRNQGLQTNKAETEIVTNYKQFVEFCEENVNPYKEIGYDVETNALPVMSKDHRIVGFSLASGKSKGCYVPLRALDFKIKKEDRELIRDKLKEIVSNKNKDIWVYNCMHEIPVTWNWNGYFMENVKDLYVIAKLMNCGKRGIRGSMGLKNLCKVNLGLEDWSKDLDDYFDLLKNLDEPNKDNRMKMKAMMAKYYDGEELEKIIKAIENLYNHLKTTGEIKNEVLSYEYVPYKLIGRYGSLDASNMFALRDYYYQQMEKENKTLGIDMFKGFELWQKHHIAGATLEMNGAYWNDEKAEELGQWCIQTMKTNMKKLLLHPLTEGLLKKRLSYDFSVMLIQDFVTEIIRSDFIPVRTYKDSIKLELVTMRSEELVDQIIKERKEENKEREERNKELQISLRRKLKATEIERPIFVPEISIDKNGKKTTKLDTETFFRLAEIQGFFKVQPYLFPNWFKGKMKEIEENDMSIEEMKGLVNITSTSKEFKDYLSSILITQDVRIAHFLCALCQYLDDPNFASWQIKTPEDNKFVTEVQEIMSLSDDFYDPEKFRKFKTVLIEFINNYKFGSYKLLNLLTESYKYKLERLDSAAIEELYNYYGMMDIDINDDTTWTKEYEWMFAYKVFKKLSKVYTTYVYGASTGRNNVCYVDKKELQSGNTFCKRIANYNDDYQERSKEGLDTILNSGFFVNGAATGRWQSGLHNISNGDPKNVYTSRFVGGTIMAPDYSRSRD